MAAKTRVLGVVIVVALVVAACSGDDGTASEPESDSETVSTDGESAPADEYLEAVALAWAPLGSSANAAFLDAVGAILSGTDAEVLDSAGAAVTQARDALATTRDDLSALDPPEAHRDDHARLTALVGDLDDSLDEIEVAIASGETDTLSRSLADIASLIERSLGELSIPMTARLAVATDVATRYPELSEEDLAYLAGVNEAGLEFGELNAAFGQAINRSYSNSERLLEALVDAGVGEGFVAQRDAASTLEPTEAFSDDHDEYLSYLDEVVAIDDQAREAADSGDIVAFSAANAELAVAGADLSASTSQPFREVRGELPLPDGLPGGDYGVALASDLDRTGSLLAGFGGPLSVYAFFGVLTADERVAATAEVAPLLAAELSVIRDRVTALDPPTALVADHDILVMYLDALVEIHADIEAAAGGADGQATDAAVDELAATWCATATDLSVDSAPLAAAHFGAAPTDPRCG